MKPQLAFPERHGGIVLFVSGIAAWLGAAGAALGGHDPVAITAIPTGAGLLGAAAYYSRVLKFAGVELAEVVLEEGGTYEAPPDVTPTEAVQDFARQLAQRFERQRGPERSAIATDHPYFVHVDQPIPPGMVARATWEGTDGFARYLEGQGWDVRPDAPVNGRRVDLVATRDDEQLWVEVKGVIYALNPTLIREIAKQFPSPSQAPPGVKLRRALFLPAPPLVVSHESLADFRENGLELWYGDDRAPERFVRAA